MASLRSVVADRRGWIRLAVAGLLAVALGYLALRGVWRGIVGSGDLTYGFSAGYAWFMGRDPYDAAVLEDVIVAAGGPVLEIAIGHGVYFPPALPLFVPIAFASWDQARLMWLVADLLATGFIAIGAVRLLAWSVRSTKGLALIAFIVALAPIHTTIAFGQTALLATAGLMAGMLLERSGSRRAAGIGYGFATALKVQIGLPFLAYLAWRRRWLTLVVSSAAVIILSTVAILRMEAVDVAWLATWLENLAWLSGPDGNGSPLAPNPDRFSLINLTYLTHAWFDDEIVAEGIAFGFLALAGLAMLWVCREEGRDHDLLAISMVAVLTLLVTYHRYYDAVLVVFPITWAFATIDSARWRPGLVALVLCVSFMLPIQTGLHELEVAGLVPTSIASSALWGAVALTFHVWVLVAVYLVMLWVGATGRRRAGPEPGMSSPVAVTPDPEVRS